MKIMQGMEQGSPEWLKFRREHIGASDASTIMGLNPFETRERLLQEKVHGIQKVLTDKMRDGQLKEPVARLHYELRTGICFDPLVAEDDEFSFLSSSFDGVSKCLSRAVEIKCGNHSHSLAQKGKIPPYYMAQLQHQMMVGKWSSIDYFSFDGKEGILITVERDDSFIAKMLDLEIEFWNCVTHLTHTESQNETIGIL